MSDNIEKYKLSATKKILIWLTNYELGESIINSVRATRYWAMDQFASNLVNANDKVFEGEQDFLFTLSLDPITEIQLKKYLLKQKKVILNYITNNEYNLGSHLYQFYLQYTCDELDELEKNVFLKNYASMLKDLKGEKIANQKVISLKKRLNI